MKKAKRAPESCVTCSQPLRLPCPACGRLVHLIDGEYDAHDASECTGSHMVYGSCTGSKKKVPRPKKMTGKASSAMVWDNPDGGAALVRIDLPALKLLALSYDEREKVRKDIEARIVRALQTIEV